MSRSRTARELLRVMPRPSAKAIEMSARLRQRFYTCVGILLLLGSSGACDDGVVTIGPLPAAGGGPGALAEAGTGGSSTSGTGSFGDGRGGAGGMARLPPPLPCDDGTELELAREQELREAFFDAYNSGAYCSNLSNSERRTLLNDRDLEWRARATSCVAFDSANWVQVSRALVAWVLIDTPSVEDAKQALLGGDHMELCEEAERTPFRFAGVGHLSDKWTVFLSPGAAEDMQKP